MNCRRAKPSPASRRHIAGLGIALQLLLEGGAWGDPEIDADEAWANWP
ncbi:MAG: hypothetical protein R2845_00060 [Thermomicrobiales bacterium]